MKSDILIFILTFVTLTYYVGLNKSSLNFVKHLVPVKSTIDDHIYFVRDLPDKLQAANNIAIIKKNSIILVNHMFNKFKTDETKLLKENFNENNFIESGDNKKYTSYSINKGEKIVLCLRNKNSKDLKLVDINTMMYVTIHELSHLMTKSVGHKKEFWDNFKLLLEEAILLKLWNKVDYKQNPKEYCGITISSTAV